MVGADTTIAVACRKVGKDFGAGETRGPRPGRCRSDSPLRRANVAGRTQRLRQDDADLDHRRIAALDQRAMWMSSVRSQSEMSPRRLVQFRAVNVGFVFQQYNLLPALTAAENVAVPLLIAGFGRREAVRRARQILDAVDLTSRADALPRQLSGGQQQRVAIARALIHEPRLLVCDEPTAALDARSGQTVLELVRRVAVQKDRAVIVVTHDSRIFSYGDRIIAMADGRVESVIAQVAGEPTQGERDERA